MPWAFPFSLPIFFPKLPMSDAAIADPRPYDLLIRQARLFADPQLAAAPQTETDPQTITLWDIGMRDGKIAEIEPHLPGPATQEIDAQGNLASPPLGGIPHSPRLRADRWPAPLEPERHPV